MEHEERLEKIEYYLNGGDWNDAEALALGYFDTVRDSYADNDYSVAILKRFKGAKRFRELASISERAIRSRTSVALIYTLYAQGLIDQGYVDAGIDLLLARRQFAQTDQERSEFGGLLGRAFKQRYVNAVAQGYRHEDDLRRAIHHYQEVYSLDRAWHGANLVALVHRAERDRIPLDRRESSAKLARFVIDGIREDAQGEPNYWQIASIAEASLALKDWETVKEHYTQFIRHPCNDPFAMASAIRQLREVWGALSGGEDPISRILTQVEIKALSYPQGGGEVFYTPDDSRRVLQAIQSAQADELAEQFGNLEAIHGENKQTSAYIMRRLLSREDAVCRVVDRNKHPYTPSGGTGFMVDPKDLRDTIPQGEFDDWKEPLLVTNNHVLSDDGRSPSVRLRYADAVFDNLGESFRVNKILWHSPREELDISVAKLEWNSSQARPDTIPLNMDQQPLSDCSDCKSDNKVYIVGHPMGRGLEFSLADNLVVDHDFINPGTPVFDYRRVHYGAPTEHGNSGSPVLDENEFAVIGVHRAIARNPIRDRPDIDPYNANEAVAALSIRERLQGRIGA
jgi:hypothetical protein